MLLKHPIIIHDNTKKLSTFLISISCNEKDFDYLSY